VVELPNWENLGIAGALLFVVFMLGNKLIDGWNRQRGNSILELCKRIDSFTETNAELLRLLTQSLVMFEKDQKEIIQNLTQVIHTTTYLTASLSRIEARTEKCEK
jgi:hypothetical protein